MANKRLKIWCYDTESDTLHELYYQDLPSDYEANDRIVDARSYPENGVDILYFTDNYNEVRQLRCEFNTPLTTTLTDFDLSLQRYGANGSINLDSTDVVSQGGSLLSGTYQFAYRLVDPDRKIVTKWSSLTNPIHIYSQEFTTNAYYNSSYGLATDRKIIIDINPSPSELVAFNNKYFQLAVIENIYPTGSTSALNASLLPIEPLSARTNFQYKSNYKIGTIPIEDIVVDYASLQTAKTIGVSGNRLFIGNVKYSSLQYDADAAINSGKPQITAGSILEKYVSHQDLLSLERSNSVFKGYFRDEVYRFGIVYFDKYGNRSKPHVLDMSSVTGNGISGATDMKFPARSAANKSILDSSNRSRILGLNLTVRNHPTWATGFEIVRENRIKKVLFQTPVIPMTGVKGVGAIDTYPSTGETSTGQKTFTSAQPQTSDTVYVPKNLAWPELREIKEYTGGSVGATWAKRRNGEAQFARKTDYNMAALFPQENIYENKDYVFKGYEKINTVDYVFAKANIINYGDVVYYGNNVNTDISATFYGLEHDHYYYHDTSTSKTAINEDASLIDAVYMDNYSSGTTMSGAKIETYGDLQTTGVTLGYKPNVQRKVVCKLNTSLEDEGAKSISFSVGTHNAYAGNGFVYASSGLKYQAAGTYDSRYFYINNTPNAFPTTPFQVIRIANVINPNVGDDRYGDKDSQREFISTGTVYTFTESQLASVQNKVSLPVSVDVFGGDCFISSHVFKVIDSTYSVVRAEKMYGGTLFGDTASFDYQAGLWGTVFKIATDAVLCMPVALKGVSQFVQVFLESEYVGQAMDKDVLVIKTSGGSPITAGTSYVQNLENTTGAKSSNRTSLAYNTNINLKLNNTNKVYYAPLDYYDSIIQSNFGARIHYSDIKLYNSTEQGFDTFRVANYYDLEEAGGNLTKIAQAGDALFAIQTKRVSYLPAGERLLETTDAGILSVGASGVIGKPRILDATRGSQHLGAIVENGAEIFIADNINKAVYMLTGLKGSTGNQLMPISDLGVASLFREKMGTVFVEKNLGTVYDPVRKEFWFYSKTAPYFCYVYNAALQQWVSNYEFASDALLCGGEWTNQNLFVVGKTGGQITIYKMYTGDYNVLFGKEVTPRVTFVVNPDEGFSKTFDDMSLVASERLDNIDLVVERELSMGNQIASEINVDVFPVEGNYRIKVLRDPKEERLRGLRMLSTLRWKLINVGSTISAIYTKYRLSSRHPF